MSSYDRKLMVESNGKLPIDSLGRLIMSSPILAIDGVPITKYFNDNKGSPLHTNFTRVKQWIGYKRIEEEIEGSLENLGYRYIPIHGGLEDPYSVYSREWNQMFGNDSLSYVSSVSGITPVGVLAKCSVYKGINIESGIYDGTSEGFEIGGVSIESDGVITGSVINKPGVIILGFVPVIGFSFVNEYDDWPRWEKISDSGDLISPTFNKIKQNNKLYSRVVYHKYGELCTRHETDYWDKIVELKYSRVYVSITIDDNYDVSNVEWLPIVSDEIDYHDGFALTYHVPYEINGKLINSASHLFTYKVNGSDGFTERIPYENGNGVTVYDYKYTLGMCGKISFPFEFSVLK